LRIVTTASIFCQRIFGPLTKFAKIFRKAFFRSRFIKNKLVEHTWIVFVRPNTNHIVLVWICRIPFTILANVPKGNTLGQTNLNGIRSIFFVKGRTGIIRKEKTSSNLIFFGTLQKHLKTNTLRTSRLISTIFKVNILTSIRGCTFVIEKFFNGTIENRSNTINRTITRRLGNNSIQNGLLIEVTSGKIIGTTNTENGFVVGRIRIRKRSFGFWFRSRESGIGVLFTKRSDRFIRTIRTRVDFGLVIGTNFLRRKFTVLLRSNGRGFSILFNDLCDRIINVRSAGTRNRFRRFRRHRGFGLPRPPGFGLQAMGITSFIFLKDVSRLRNNRQTVS